MASPDPNSARSEEKKFSVPILHLFTFILAVSDVEWLLFPKDDFKWEHKNGQLCLG